MSSKTSITGVSVLSCYWYCYCYCCRYCSTEAAEWMLENKNNCCVSLLTVSLWWWMCVKHDHHYVILLINIWSTCIVCSHCMCVCWLCVERAVAITRMWCVGLLARLRAFCLSRFLLCDTSCIDGHDWWLWTIHRKPACLQFALSLPTSVGASNSNSEGH